MYPSAPKESTDGRIGRPRRSRFNGRFSGKKFDATSGATSPLLECKGLQQYKSATVHSGGLGLSRPLRCKNLSRSKYILSKGSGRQTTVVRKITMSSGRGQSRSRDSSCRMLEVHALQKLVSVHANSCISSLQDNTRHRKTHLLELEARSK